MVIIMITRGRLAIRNVVTFVESLMDVHINVYMALIGLDVLITFTERTVRRHMDIS